MHTSWKRLKLKGFTIVELLIVIVVIGILATISIVTYNGVQKTARDKAIVSDIDAVSSEVSRYSINHSGTLGSSVTWFSGGGANANIQFTPTAGDVIDVVANAGLYCVRGYNPSSNKNTIANSYSKGSNDDACNVLSASVAAGGTGDSSLIGWWKLNQDALDSSGNGNGGFVNATTSIAGANGVPGGAYAFDGSTSYIGLSGLNMAVSSNFSLSSWVNLDATINSGWNFIFGGGPGDFGFGVQTNAAPIAVFTKVNIVDAGISNSPITKSVWHQLGFTYNSGSIIYYLDGQPFGAATLSSTYPVTIKNIGRSSTGASTGYFKGGIDDVRLYSKTLSASDMTNLYTNGAQ
jgi:prepilin-type N-terminal cleavage/methylation domain-containing protein